MKRFEQNVFQPINAAPLRAVTHSLRPLIRAAAVETTDTTTDSTLVDKSVNTIRFLTIDAVEKAKSGHPGLPMGCAPMSHILYDEAVHNTKNPYWFNRDRFVLSAGHGCMLQYALLHLAGYDSVRVCISSYSVLDYSIKRNLERLELFIRREVLKSFRQWGSKTPGHPENFETPGVEVTTGPLGQGIANAVGLALAEKHLAARFNKPDNEIVDHYTSDVVVFWIIGDGCQMEGITNEVCSLAGHWGLGKLIAFYDDNHISIDGDTEIAFTENVDKRFEALGCHVIWVKNGNNGHDEIRKLIQCPRSEKEVEATRNNLGWPCEPFQVPEDVKSHWSRHTPEGAALEADWNAKFAAYEKKYPEEVEKLKSIISGNLPAGWEKALPTYTPESPGDATRNLSQQCLNALAKSVPGFLGGVLTLHSKTLHLKEETSGSVLGNTVWKLSATALHFTALVSSLTAQRSLSLLTT
ncbi:hypothetical protein Bca101_041508 [Brassica carinata]